MIKTYKYRLYPTPTQIKCLEETFNACRFLYNCALEERKSYYNFFGKGTSYNFQAAQLLEIKELFPEYKDIYAQVLQLIYIIAEEIYLFRGRAGLCSLNYQEAPAFMRGSSHRIKEYYDRNRKCIGQNPRFTDK